jgi:hypothetical protein
VSFRFGLARRGNAGARHARGAPPHALAARRTRIYMYAPRDPGSRLYNE